MDRPLISVIIPAYNCEQYISQTIESVLNQSYENLEVVIVDDASNDSTTAIIDGYAKSDSRIKFLKNEINRGVSYTRNRAIRHAAGEWAALLDSDDYWEYEKLELQMELLQKTAGFMCSTGRGLMDENGKDMGRMIPVPETITYKMLLKTNYIVCSSVLIKRALLLEFPMAHDEMHEDYVCWLQIAKKYGAICGLNIPAVNYRVLKGSKSGNKWKSFLMQNRSYQFVGIHSWEKWKYLFLYGVNGVIKYGKL